VAKIRTQRTPSINEKKTKKPKLPQQSKHIIAAIVAEEKVI